MTHDHGTMGKSNRLHNSELHNGRLEYEACQLRNRLKLDAHTAPGHFTSRVISMIDERMIHLSVSSRARFETFGVSENSAAPLLREKKVKEKDTKVKTADENKSVAVCGIGAAVDLRAASGIPMGKGKHNKDKIKNQIKAVKSVRGTHLLK